MKGDLLNRLAELTGAAYLSELHGSVSRQAIHDALCGMTPEGYPLEEWEEAVGYVLMEANPHFDTAQSAYRYFCEKLDETAGLKGPLALE